MGLAIVPLFSGAVTHTDKEQGIFGGPSDQAWSPRNIVLETASASSEGFSLSAPSVQSTPFEASVLPGSLVSRETTSAQPASRDNLLTYKIQKGDTLSGIASYFGVSIDTIVNANPGIRGKYLVLGDVLKILPTSGSVYITQEGDTLESIANYFNVPTNTIQSFNKSVDFNTLGVGVDLVIPGVRSFAQQKKGALPNFNANFVKPSDGFNWGKLHHYNAVDIANTCGTPVVASAEGLVIPDENFGDGKDGWNGGYGSFVLIEHPFGDSVRTRYAHLSKVSVEIGDYVKQGQYIGIMGETGDATGCHIHFEVYGAENPFTRQ